MKRKISLLLATLLIFSACTQRVPPIDTTENTNPVVVEPIVEKEPEPIIEQEQEQESTVEPEQIVEPVVTNQEIRAVWFSYLDFNNLLDGKSEKEFKSNIDTAFKNCANLGLNTVIVQIRPFGNALYDSMFFPYLSFDPLKIMVTYAHKYDLKIEAWINPYRVKEEYIINDDWVLKSDSGTYFYDPSLEEVQEYVVSGVSEIVSNYDVDGIHFDDYFYAEGYEDERYSDDECRSFVTSLVHKVHNKIKSINKNCTFGISPQADLEKCFYKFYADIETWAKNGYIDYIAPQIYYGFYNSNIQFSGCASAWDEIISKTNCQLLLGLAMYKSGEVDTYAGNGKSEWVENNDTIAAQIIYGRELKSYNGFILFRYDSLFNNKNNVKQELNNIKWALNN